MASLEASAFAEWVRTSYVGYPTLLTLHSIGMAIMVGLVLVVCLRLLGKFERIPLISLERMLVLAWVGFAINLLSGAAIFTMAATVFATKGLFLLKLAAVLTGAGLAAYMQQMLKREAAGWANGGSVPGGLRNLAAVSLSLWGLAIVTGRLTAYL